MPSLAYYSSPDGRYSVVYDVGTESYVVRHRDGSAISAKDSLGAAIMECDRLYREALRAWTR